MISIAIISALLIVICALVIYALGISYKVDTDAKFFLGIKKLTPKELFSSLAASWLMLGNVFLACLILGKYYGLNSWWIIGTWLLAFLLMKRHVGDIQDRLDHHRTLHSFLGSSFNSTALRKLAGLITILSGIGIIALEIIVVMALLVPVVGASSLILPFIGGFVILATLAAYCVLGGFTAITQTDKYQLAGVLLGLAAVIVIIVHGFINTDIVSTDKFYQIFGTSLADSGTSTIWFFLGLACLQIPLFLGDFGTWQRIKVASGKIQSNQKTFGLLGYLNAAMWIILILAGITIASVADEVIPAFQDSYLYSTAGPIVDLVSLATLSWQAAGAWVGWLLVFSITVGLTCAMMSTTDTYLLIAIQALHDDLLERPSTGKSGMHFAQGASLAGVVAAFAIAIIIVINKANFLPIISLLFSLQVSVAPLAVLALYKKQASDYSDTAVISLALTIILCVLYSIWATFWINVPLYHQVNVTFILPVMAFGIPSASLCAHILINEGIGPALSWLKSFLGVSTKPKRT